MAKYTTEVRSICETLAGYTEQQGFGNIESIIETAAPLLFNFDFPIFDENYRLTLETKILRHFYTREIGEETVGLWKLRLDARLNDIMPYYNQLYESELLEFNPLYDVDVTTTGNKDTTGETSGTTEGVTSNVTVTDTDTTGNSDRDIYTETQEWKEQNTEVDYSETSENTNILDRDDYEKNTGAHYTENTESGSQNTERNSDDTGTVKVTTDNSGTSNNTTTKDGDNWNKYSDTPQGGLSGISSDTYLTNAENDIIDEEGTSKTTTTDEGTQLTTNDLNTLETVAVVNNNAITNEVTDSTDRTYSQDSKTTDDGSKNSITTTAHTEQNLGTSGTQDNTSEVGTLDSTVTSDGTTGKTSTGTSSSLTDYAEKVLGKRGSMTYSKMLQEFRETFLNIDMQIIHQLDDLFLNLW